MTFELLLDVYSFAPDFIEQLQAAREEICQAWQRDGAPTMFAEIMLMVRARKLRGEI